jgi:hypothetical protein
MKSYIRISVLVALVASLALAAQVGLAVYPADRDATAKMLGKYAGGERKQPSTTHYTPRTMTYMRPAARPVVQPTTEVRQDSSYQVPTVKAGDTLTVAANAKLMVGNNALGTLPKGQTISVLDVQDGWVGTQVDVHGKTLIGWVPQNAVQVTR